MQHFFTDFLCFRGPALDGALAAQGSAIYAPSAQWLRGIVRREMLQDAQVLLDSARLSATQRSRVAQSLLRRFDNFNSFRDYW